MWEMWASAFYPMWAVRARKSITDPTVSAAAEEADPHRHSALD